MAIPNKKKKKQALDKHLGEKSVFSDSRNYGSGYGAAVSIMDIGRSIAKKIRRDNRKNRKKRR